MIIEQQFFLDVLSDHLNYRKTCKPSINLNWSKLLYFAQIHQVEGIIYFQCKDFLPTEIKNTLKNKYCYILCNYANREYLINQLFENLKEEKIDFFIVKGLSIALFYPFSSLRTMGDTDLVVHTEYRNKVHSILLEQGYKNVSRFEDREWIYTKGVFEIELHDRLIYSESINRKELEDFFANFWIYVHDGELDWNYHFLYLILHLRKHLMNYGVGFRQFLDIATIIKNNNSLDWSYIEKQLITLDLIEFSRTVFSLNEIWFGIKSPLQSKVIDDLFFQNATEHIFRNGVFGFDNAENRDNVSINNVLKSKNRKFEMIKSAICKLFPSYENMITVPMYSFLIGKKWLLPWAWIYRFYIGASKKRIATGVNSVKSSLVSDDKIEKRTKWLKQWGLEEIDTY